MLGKTDLLGIAGFGITVVGFFLIPFLIGLPMMLAGWLVMLYATCKHMLDLLVPKEIQNKVVRKTLESYKPYQPAIKSLTGLLGEIVKTALLITAIVATSIVAWMIL
jgi:hypothetical protein